MDVDLLEALAEHDRRPSESRREGLLLKVGKRLPRFVLRLADGRPHERRCRTQVLDGLLQVVVHTAVHGPHDALRGNGGQPIASRVAA